jgi:hypothetical protein
MRSLWLIWMLPLVAAAQAPPADLTGMLLERDPSSASGEFSIRAADSEVFRFQYGPQTRVEREQQASDFGRLRTGEKVEVISDAVDGSLLRLARVIRVIVPLPPPAMTHSVRTVAPAERLVASANLTFAGVVSQFTPQRLVLHTREGDRTILIRKDTRYVADGGTVEAAALQPNMRVYVQAGKDLYERLEAYRIIWGRIFDPGR